MARWSRRCWCPRPCWVALWYQRRLQRFLGLRGAGQPAGGGFMVLRGGRAACLAWARQHLPADCRWWRRPWLHPRRHHARAGAEQVICWCAWWRLPVSPCPWPGGLRPAIPWRHPRQQLDGVLYVGVVFDVDRLFAWYRALALGLPMRAARRSWCSPFLSLFAVPLAGRAAGWSLAAPLRWPGSSHGVRRKNR